MTITEPLTVQETNSTPSSKRPWCLFQSGTSAYAVRLETVAEVVEVERLVRVPLAPPRIVGLCTLRRDVIPVVELGESALEPSADLFCTKTIVLMLRTTRGIWGVRVNAEGTMVTEENMDEFAASENPPGQPTGTRLATLRNGTVLYNVIDPETTWHDVRGSVESWYQVNQDVERAGDHEASSRSISSLFVDKY